MVYYLHTINRLLLLLNKLGEYNNDKIVFWSKVLEVTKEHGFLSLKSKILKQSI